MNKNAATTIRCSTSAIAIELLQLLYDTGSQCTEYSKDKKMKTKNQHAEIMEVIAKKVEEESQPHTVGSIPDRYEEDDDSYLKRVPKLNNR